MHVCCSFIAFQAYFNTDVHFTAHYRPLKGHISNQFLSDVLKDFFLSLLIQHFFFVISSLTFNASSWKLLNLFPLFLPH